VRERGGGAEGGGDGEVEGEAIFHKSSSALVHKLGRTPYELDDAKESDHSSKEHHLHRLHTHTHTH
jgi:hypothetical protein